MVSEPNSCFYLRLVRLCRAALPSEGFGSGLGDPSAASRCFRFRLPEPQRGELRPDGALRGGHLPDEAQAPARPHPAGPQERLCPPTAALEHQQEAR